MITNPCNCGIMPRSHAHIANSKNKDEIIWFKGIPIVMDISKEKEFYMLNSNKAMTLPTRRKGKIKPVKSSS